MINIRCIVFPLLGQLFIGDVGYIPKRTPNGTYKCCLHKHKNDQPNFLHYVIDRAIFSIM